MTNRLKFPSQEHEVEWYDSQEVKLSFVGLIALSSIVRNEVALRGNFETFNFEFDS